MGVGGPSGVAQQVIGVVIKSDDLSSNPGSRTVEGKTLTPADCSLSSIATP